MEDREFRIGEHVSYGTSGICIIEGIEMMSLATGMPKQLYYVLKPACNYSSTVYVPQGNEKLASKIRHLLTKDQILDIISRSKKNKMEWSNDRRYRSDKFHEILSAGVSSDMLLMIECIRSRKKKLAEDGKKLPATDNTVLKQAQKLVAEEFSYVLEIKQSQVPDFIANNQIK